MPLSKKNSITVAEVALIKVSFLKIGSKQNNKNEHGEYHDILNSFKDKIYSKQGSHISLLFGTWTLVLFPHAGVQLEIFQGRADFVELRQFDKHFVKNTRKKISQGKHLEIFILDTVKTTF